MNANVDRRRFLGSAVATGAFTIVPRHVLGGEGQVPPSEKIRLAHIGMGTQGFRELEGVLSDPHLQVVAVCDPNRDSNDYVEWGKNGIRNLIRKLLGQPGWREGVPGCPGGREVGRQVVDACYARQGQTVAPCSAYADYRELLDKERDLDAVKIMTPDHLHACISIAAMRKGLHVLVHKPLANRLSEGRLVVQTAGETGVQTHLLAYGSGTGNGQIAGAIQQGAIGRLREIHNWTNRPVWPQYTQIPTDRPPVPDGLDWDLWLGPALDRPYHPHYTHTVFRGWYDFGGGSLADMGIYSLWPVFAALGLDVPAAADAHATHTCTIEDHVSRTVKNDFSYPTACSMRFAFAARGETPAWDLFWYDGGMKPRLPEQVERHEVELAREGILFVGDAGAILAGFRGQSPRLFAGGKQRPLELEPEKPAAGSGTRRHDPWVHAIRSGTESPGSFLRAAAITDTVNLGTVALRAGRRCEFDSPRMRITNAEHANRYLTREYRPGWELG